VAGKLRRRVARHGPEIALALVVLLSGVSLWQAWDLSGHLREEAAQASRIYGRVIAALNDTAAAAQTEALLEVVREIGKTGLPVIVTDSGGVPSAMVNLPDAATRDTAALQRLIAEFDAQNIPFGVPQLGVVHYGLLPVGQRLRRLGALQLALLACAVAAGIWAYRAAVDRDRDRMWVAMARESAHQLGTPLMSANAWVDRLLERGTHTGEIAGHLLADLERLHRVAQRFERIGRPARRDRVAVGATAAGPFVAGDPVLLEWALEALVRNAVDALSGRDGTITLQVACDARHAVVRVLDDGPGIAPEVRGRLFEPGATTKSGGWGIGLALARRIVEDVHDGRLTLGSPAIGTEFVLDLPLDSA
jgi:signal transduction histidine kinase